MYGYWPRWREAVSLCLRQLELGPARDARIWDNVADITHPTYVHQQSGKAQPKARMRDRAVFAKIKIPGEILQITKAHLRDSVGQLVVPFFTPKGADEDG